MLTMQIRCTCLSRSYIMTLEFCPSLRLILFVLDPKFLCLIDAQIFSNALLYLYIRLEGRGVYKDPNLFSNSDFLAPIFFSLCFSI